MSGDMFTSGFNPLALLQDMEAAGGPGEREGGFGRVQPFQVLRKQARAATRAGMHILYPWHFPTLLAPRHLPASPSRCVYVVCACVPTARQEEDDSSDRETQGEGGGVTHTEGEDTDAGGYVT